VTDETVTIGVIGGSGLYSLFEEGTAVEVDVDTPYGPTSSPITVGTMAGRRVAFLTRHGRTHSVPPHRIEYRANTWALRSLGVRALLSSSAVGGLHPDYGPGTFVVTDQIIDRTHGRADTFFDEDGVQHLTFADPFDPVLRAVAVDALDRLGVAHRPTGTCVVIQGPRFSTRAESLAHRASGGHTINMTMAPEVPLAAELGMGAVNLSYVTDADAGLAEEAGSAVSHALVMERLADANRTIVAAIEAIVAALPDAYEPRELVPADATAAVLARPTTGTTTGTSS
jgi:5'-methylthioadenosine phosphorylase